MGVGASKWEYLKRWVFYTPLKHLPFHGDEVREREFLTLRLYHYLQSSQTCGLKVTTACFPQLHITLSTRAGHEVFIRPLLSHDRRDSLRLTNSRITSDHSPAHDQSLGHHPEDHSISIWRRPWRT